MEAPALPITQPKEDHLSKPTIRIPIPLLSGKSTSPTIVDIAEEMAKYRAQMGESSEDEDYEEGMEEGEEGEEGLEEDDDDEDSESDDNEEDSLDEEIEERELSPSEIENMLPAGPKVNRFSGVIERIERMYGGEYSKGRKQDDYDFEDSFIDDSDWRTYSDAPKTKHDGFFINKGTLELAEESENSSNAFQDDKKKAKRKRSLDKDGKDGSKAEGKDEKERPKKKTKNGSSPAKDKGSKIPALALQSTSPPSSSNSSGGQFVAPKPKSAAVAGLSPSVESAIQALEKAIPLHPLAEGGKKRLPRELDAHLYKVAMEARNTHPQGHIAASITQRLVKCLPFNERTIKHHMKRVLDSKTAAEEESIEEKIESLVEELKIKVVRTRAISPSPKWKWDREAGNLLHTIFELVDAKVELHNKLHEKEPEQKLSDRLERKKVAEEIAKFWPADQMTAKDILKKNTSIKSNKKRATGKPDGESGDGKDKEKKADSTTKTEKKDGSGQKESKKESKKEVKKENKSNKADKKEKQQKKDEKEQKKKKSGSSIDKEKKASSSSSSSTTTTTTDKKASSSDDRKPVERKPSPTTTPQPLASPPAAAAAASVSPTPGAPIVRQTVPAPGPVSRAHLPHVVTKAATPEEEDDDIIILS